MEIVTIEAFKVGDEVFIKKEDAEKYEERLITTKNSTDIMQFLLKKGYSRIGVGHVKFQKKIGFRIHRFEFINIDHLYYALCTDELQPKKVWEQMEINISNVESFESFYENILRK